jgi:hypothetical protein
MSALKSVTRRITRRGFELGLAALVALRLWLVAGQTIWALGSAAYDDALFMRLAGSLTQGRWLGPYDHLTLAKGPFYPMWIAASFRLGVPLLLGQHLLYALACAVFVSGLAPALRAKHWRAFLFTALLFNPASYDALAMTRVTREGVYPALTLLVLGTAAGSILRLGGSRGGSAGWGLALGASSAAFWLCREERAWIAPALLLMVAGLVVRERPVPWRRLAGTLAVSFAPFLVLVGGVQAENFVRYRAFVVTELTEGPFQQAYAALARVSHEGFRPYVPLPVKTRAQIYAVSSSFAELRPFLEGAAGQAWTSVGCSSIWVCDDIAGGWMLWALRDSAAAAGKYRDAARAADYWRAVASEVNAACDAGRLACSATLPAYLPQLRREYLPIAARSLEHAFIATATFEGASSHPRRSVGPEPLLLPFRALSLSRLSPLRTEGKNSPPAQGGLDARKLAILDGIVTFYQCLVPMLAGCALVALACGIAWAVRRRRPPPLLVITCALLVGAAVRVMLIALVDATSFGAIYTHYLSPAYPLLLGFIALAGPAAMEARGSR